MSRIWEDVRAAAVGPAGPRPARPAARQAPKRAEHAPRVPFAILVVTLMAGGLGLLLLLNTASAANEVRRHALAEQDASIAAQVQQLQNEVAASAAPGNLARAAADLGMVPAGNPAFLVVGPDGSVRVMGSPKPVSDAALAAIPAKQSASPSPSKSASRSATASKSPRASTGTDARRSANRTPSGRTTPATPTSTPTPTVILPGGNR